MQPLSIIVPTRNEPLGRLERTLRTLRNTQTVHHEILLMDDNSDQNYNALASRYDCNLQRAPSRMGLHWLLEQGASLATKDFLYTIDSHMEMYPNEWDREMYQTLEANPFVQTCHVSRAVGTRIKKYGARLISDSSSQNWLEPTWHDWKCGDTIDVPLGACYGIRKSWFNYLGGVRGLTRYGCNEAFLALKNIGAGGSTVLLNTEVGHDYSKTPLPEHDVRTRFASLLLNKAFIYDVLLRGLVAEPAIYDSAKSFSDAKEVETTRGYIAAIISSSRLKSWLEDRGFRTAQQLRS